MTDYSGYRKEVKKVHHELVKKGMGIPDKSAPEGKRIPRKVLNKEVARRFLEYRKIMQEAREELIKEKKSKMVNGKHVVSRTLLMSRIKKIKKQRHIK